MSPLAAVIVDPTATPSSTPCPRILLLLTTPTPLQLLAGPDCTSMETLSQRQSGPVAKEIALLFKSTPPSAVARASPSTLVIQLLSAKD